MQSADRRPSVFSLRCLSVSRGVQAVLIGLFVLLILGDRPAVAQWEQLELEPLSPSVQARGGIHLMTKGRADEARSILERAYTAHPDLVLPAHGAVGYWLGEAHARTGDSARARSTWRAAFERLHEAGRFDVQLADAYLRTLSRQQLRDERLRAVDAYLALLGSVTPDTSSALTDLFRRRVAQIAPLLPDDVFGQVVNGERDASPDAWTLRDGAGKHLQAWWRGLDPFPGTPENERLEEHLTRLVHARESFSCPESATAFDQRGTIYLRLGAPYKRHDLNYKDGKFFREVFRFGVHIPPDAFPESEIWVYPQIDDSGFYLFAEEGSSDCYELARTNDLLPSTLTRQRSKTERGLNYAYSALMAMQAIYSELALYHITFSNRYSDIASYAGYQEMAATRARMDELSDISFPNGGERRTRVGAGATARTVTENPAQGIQAPNDFVGRMTSRAEQEDRAAARRREENMPRQYTALRDDTPQLPVVVRTARFLNEDGTTRTEVYWGVPTAAMQLSPPESGEKAPPSMLRFSAVRHNETRSRVQRKNARYRLSARPAHDQQVFVPDPVVFDGLTARHHLSLQWTQHRLWVSADSARTSLGPKRRFTIARADSLSPLRASGPAPEMSDLKALTVPDSVATAPASLRERARPYPFRMITADRPLLLSFEAYHLSFGPDDRTRYTVAYEVRGRTRRGWTRLFRGQDTQRTTTETTVQGTSRRVDEAILLDLSRIEHQEVQDVRVRVRVTDEVTGSSVARSLDFVLQPSAPR
jgi:GWxTD domain-containing protein